MPPTTGMPGRRGRIRLSPPSMAAVACAYARATGTMPTEFPINHNEPLGFIPYPTVPPLPAVADRRPEICPAKERSVPSHSFIVNGKRVNVDCEGDVRLLWVLRDLLGIHGPKYGCGLESAAPARRHINGKAFNPCSVPVSQIKHDDEITTIEGLAATVGSRCTRCSRPGSTTTSPSAATASRVRS